MIVLYVLVQEKRAFKIYVSILLFYVLAIPFCELWFGFIFVVQSCWHHLGGSRRGSVTKGSLKAQSTNGDTTSFARNNRSEATLPQMKGAPNVPPVEASDSFSGTPEGAWRAQDHRSATMQSMA